MDLSLPLPTTVPLAWFLILSAIRVRDGRLWD